MTTKSDQIQIDTQIKHKTEQLNTLKLIQKRYPDAISSYLEDSSVVLMSPEVIKTIAGFHFTFDNFKRNFYIRPYTIIKLRKRANIKIYAQQSALITDGNLISKILNKMGEKLTLEDLPKEVQQMFGQVISQ